MRLVQTRNKRLVFGILSLCADRWHHVDDWAGASRGQPTGDHSREGDQGGNPDGWCKPHLGRSSGRHYSTERSD